MKKIFTVFFLVLIILITVITRYYKLGDIPSGLYLDEAEMGYNAYSILKTGRDEFGKPFPLVFRSFADFKTPVYVYSIVPLIPIFGLSKYTVRFPSFFFGVFTIIIFYLLVRKIAPEKYSNSLSLISAFLLAISPWHILFSRTAFECNIALFFLASGIYLFYKGLKSPAFLLFSSLFIALAILSYHAQRIITPLLIVALAVKHKQILFSKTHIKFLLAAMLLGFIILIPTLSIAFTPGFLARANGLNIFSRAIHVPEGFIKNYNGIISLFINSRWFLGMREFLSLYLSYFSPRNMFYLENFDLRTSYPSLSTFFLWQFPFYIAGLYWFIKRRGLGELKFLTLILLLLSPIPAAITRDPYSTIRSLQMIIPLTIIIAFGIIEFYDKLKNKIPKDFFQANIFKAALITVFILTTSYCLAKLFSSAIILNEFYRSGQWNYGFEQVSKTIVKLDQKLPVIFDNARIEPYSQLLFFLKFDPLTYQKNNFEVSQNDYYRNLNRVKTKYIGNIITRPINWEMDLIKEQYLIGDHLAISDGQIKDHNLTLVSTILYPDRSVAFVITKTNPQ